jgi:hypothetical protein
MNTVEIPLGNRVQYLVRQSEGPLWTKSKDRLDDPAIIKVPIFETSE